MGKGLFVVPHGISIGPDDHVLDHRYRLRTGIRVHRGGELLRTFGEHGVAGADAAHFDRPTDVAPLPGGSFYVADRAAGNSRVMKFAADGKLLFQWGTRGAGPGQFAIPHALAVDAGRRVCVADRANDRVQLFDAKGRYLTEWKSPAIGRPFGLALLPGNRIAILDGGANPDKVPDSAPTSETIADLDGREIAHFGRIGTQRTAHALDRPRYRRGPRRQSSTWSISPASARSTFMRKQGSPDPSSSPSRDDGHMAPGLTRAGPAPSPRRASASRSPPEAASPPAGVSSQRQCSRLRTVRGQCAHAARHRGHQRRPEEEDVRGQTPGRL